ncbi:MAG: tyrosine-type recombinase/integrase [Candidatus Ranarchaeia archaeon]|jgi:site-specific recombinase XerD
MNSLHPVADYIRPFFYQYLIGSKGLSTNTILSYKNTIKFLLCFCSDYLKKPVDQLNIEDLDDKIILSYLNYIENTMENSKNTRNIRLSGIRAFFNFLSREESTVLQQCRKIQGIPAKRIEYKTVEYLDDNEVQAIFDSVDPKSQRGIRDKALFLILYNTGARVQEIVNLTIKDLRLDLPGQVKFLGKGKKQRACPLWPETVNALKKYLKEHQEEGSYNERVFLNANGKPITRFGIRHIIKQYAKKAAERCPSLKNKAVGPHTFRHSTAMHLIQAGNDINMVRLWLGHADINTTHIYVEIDLDMKQKILNTIQPPTSNTKQNNFKKWQEPNILKWLDELAKRSQGD